MIILRFLCVLLLACAFSGFASAAPETLTKVNLQLKWRHQFQFAGYYAAIEKGYYQQSGFDVTLLERTSSTTPIENLILGDADYAVVGAGALVYRANGVPLIALAAIYQRSPSILISHLDTLAALRGQNVMLSSGVMNAEINAMLQKADINSSDIRIIPSNQSIDGFIKRDYVAFNGYLANEPFYLDKLNLPYYVFSPSDYGISFYGDILVTTEQHLKTNSEQVARFRLATIKGWQYAIDHADEIVDVILAKYNSQNKSKELLTYEAKALIRAC